MLLVYLGAPHDSSAIHEAVIADLYPQDPVSGCYADMTRTFCMGEPPEELVRYHALVKDALDREKSTAEEPVFHVELPPRGADQKAEPVVHKLHVILKNEW